MIGPAGKGTGGAAEVGDGQIDGSVVSLVAGFDVAYQAVVDSVGLCFSVGHFGYLSITGEFA
ncbi:hypothetical protein [Acidiphilium sp.]|uniref:hypothetical protein n=1 Tax=Acidiphilium sp. TaxID=527 RepID=UPI003D033547